MRVATIFLAGLSLLALVVAAPTKIDASVTELSISRSALGDFERLCLSVRCLFGYASIEPSSGSCLCPEWPEWLVSETS